MASPIEIFQKFVTATGHGDVWQILWDNSLQTTKALSNYDPIDLSELISVSVAEVIINAAKRVETQGSHHVPPVRSHDTPEPETELQPETEHIDPYQLLGVSRNATKSEISKAYKKRVKIDHPDKPSGSTKKFQRLKKAYDILKKKKEEDDKNQVYIDRLNEEKMKLKESQRLREQRIWEEQRKRDFDFERIRLNQEITDLTKENEKMKADKFQQTQNNSILQSHMSGLQAQLQSSEIKNRKLEKQVDELKHKIEKLSKPWYSWSSTSSQHRKTQNPRKNQYTIGPTNHTRPGRHSSSNFNSHDHENHTSYHTNGTSNSQISSSQSRNHSHTSNHTSGTTSYFNKSQHNAAVGGYANDHYNGGPATDHLSNDYQW